MGRPPIGKTAMTDAERVMQLRNMLREARKRKLSRALAAKRELPRS